MAFAKTSRPNVAGTVPRPRLFRWLDHARRRPITWVGAPPGAGKTTLVASYLVAHHLLSLWYQVDAGDGDVATFFYFLGQTAPRRRKPLQLLTPEYRQELPIFARRFFRELYSRLKPPFTLVFDNYQEVPADSQLHEVMREAAAEIPQGGRVIFISRGDPPAAFARLRAQQALDIFDSPQLRFTRAEASALIRRLASRRWPKETILSLYESSDGWAAGLILLLEQLRSDGRTSVEPRQRSSEVLFDYFAGEIFKKADSDTKDVLLQTAFLPRVTASTAEQLTGRPIAGEILANLHRQNYFTNRRTTGEPVYEYHPLFRQFLLSQAERVYSAVRRAEICRSAADLAEAAGWIETAVGLLRDAEDWAALARLVCTHAPTLLAQGRGQTVEAWLAAIPEMTFRQNPWALYWRGLCLLGWHHADSQHDLEQAFTAFRQNGDRTGMLLAASALIQSLQGAGNTNPMDRWIGIVNELLRENPEFPSEDVETRVADAMLSAITFRQPRHPQGERWAERALELARRQPDLAFRTITALNWFYYHLQLGDLAKAALVVDEMSALRRSRDVSPVVAVNASMTVSLHEWLTACPSYRRTVSDVLELARTTGMFYTAKDVVLGSGLFGVLSDGDLEMAETWFQELEKDRPFFGLGYHSWHRMFVVREALIRGDIARAASYQPEMLRLSLAAGWPLNDAAAFLLSAQVYRARGSEKEARIHLKRGLKIAHAIRSSYIEFMARLTEAQLCLDNGQEAQGLQALRTAMALGRAGGFVNSHIWIPVVMAKLCAKALEAGIEVEYVQGLVRKRGLVPEQPPVEIEAWPWPVKIYTLGRFAVLKDGQPLSFPRKVQRKPLALLKAVIALGGRGVREELLLDTLWPEADGDAARFALTSAIHRLRRLLGHEEAIIRKDNEVSLDDRHCWVDVRAVERLLDRAEATERAADDDRKWPEAIRLTERAAELHHGPFLSGGTDAPWATPLADRIRRRLLRQFVHLGQHREQNEQWQEATDWYETGLTVDPCAEDICRHLMNAYHHLGRMAETLATYDHCRKALADRLGVTPSPETDTLLKRLRAG